jgi:hypothetical protein
VIRPTWKGDPVQTQLLLGVLVVALLVLDALTGSRAAHDESEP